MSILEAGSVSKFNVRYVSRANPSPFLYDTDNGITTTVCRKYHLEPIFRYKKECQAIAKNQNFCCKNNPYCSLGKEGKEFAQKPELQNSILEDVLKVIGEYNSLLHKQSPPPWTNQKSRFSNPRSRSVPQGKVGFACVATAPLRLCRLVRAASPTGEGSAADL
ncbi:hypothetical protein [aff. Roholtiella sp. LEGE 12411]|uniref:hypothetical protein n=1 Tax=aff. Roholtiella sp. LEGE 12411 TaxID=1828822 RepID=UPI00187F2F8C|nr:hypothetical protein [aff. Roholtiella sp. LEGE 12411]MBE9033850.1 hypothetical protein [aff. Roholtiella sp. LEGE 12411]